MTAKSIKKNFKDMDKGLFLVVFVFLTFGLLNIVTASSREALSSNFSIYHYFFAQLQMIAAGLFGGFFILQIPTTFYKKMLVPILLITISLVLSSFMFEAHRGAQIWIRFGGASLQPGEFAKPVIIVSLAVLFEKYYKLLKKNKEKARKLIPFIIITGLIVPIILILQSDLGNSLILGIVFILMFLTSPILRKDKLNHLLFLFILGLIVALSGFIVKGNLFEGYQTTRLNYSNPCSKYESSGYQICNAYIAINDGGLFGLGIGKSKQKYSYIPEPHTDMIFAITSEEYGSLAMSLVFIGYALLFHKINKISKNAASIRGKYIAFGAMCYIFMQMAVNLGGLFGMIPLTGVTLPFLSYGGSFTIALIGMISLVLRVSIENKNKKIKINHL